MKIIIHIDELAGRCGFFNDETTVNNCYGCNHPKQEEKGIDADTGKEQGACFDFSCPLGHTADLEDMKELNEELYKE